MTRKLATKREEKNKWRERERDFVPPGEGQEEEVEWGEWREGRFQ